MEFREFFTDQKAKLSMCYVGKCRLEKSHWTFVNTADVRVHTTYKKTCFSLMVFKTFLFIPLAVDSLKKIIPSSLNECTVCTVVCVCDGPPNELWSLCVDDGDPPKTATATLTVTVEDINDNAPRFLKDYRPVLPEHSAPRKVSTVAPLFWCIYVCYIYLQKSIHGSGFGAVSDFHLDDPILDSSPNILKLY